ncbi:MAG: hypothetical protein JWO69_989 [Thermoleophilia bacterium]|nr:hypothetical protein [Thermoleophilia bacterium]
MPGGACSIEGRGQMSYQERQHDPTRGAAPTPGRTGLVAPRLELPRFRLAGAAATPATVAPPAPLAPRAPQPPPVPRPTWNASPTAMPQPVQVSYAPAPVAPMAPPAPAYHAPAPATRYTPAATVAATPTRPATIAWERLEPPASERTLLQRITPVHMGVLLIMVIVAMVVTSGPAAMKTPAVTRLPALASGGGSVDGVPDQTLARAGTTATTAAAAAATPAKDVPAKPAPAKAADAVATTARHGGIPSPAASGSPVAADGGGAASPAVATTAQYGGIPSPAAAAAGQLGSQTLPFSPDDGITLPTGAGDRDMHAVDQHYGGTETLAMAEPVAQPALTPGAAAAQAERMVAQENLTGDVGLPATNEIRAF